MSTDHDSDQPREDRDTVGDQNIESLLASAYRPEMVDPAFAARVRQRAHSAAQRARVSDPRALVTRMWQNRPWQLLATVAAVALLAFTAFRVVRNGDQEPVEIYRDGDYVWIDGQPFHRTSSSASRGGGRRQVAAPNLTGVAQRDMAPRIGARGLVPRPRTGVAPLRQLAVGDSITTGPGQRQHVSLADGSQVYVNENASVSVVDDRKISIAQGEVFVEVAPSDNGGQQPTFVVDTPDRDVTAWGTRFAVHVDAGGTGVLVTQGKVKVTGVEAMIVAGQQLHADHTDTGDAAIITPLPRAAHVLNWMRDLVVAAHSPLVPRSEHSGGALIAIEPHGQQTKLSLRKYHVDVHIEDGFARTTVDQTYFNHRPGRLEGTFYFPLPPDASISRLAMYVNGRLMEGGMAEREHARTVFETIKHRSLDPALLEWIDGSTFKMRVFPLEGRQEKRIVLSYTQRLENHYGTMRYRFPAGHNMDEISQWSVHARVVRGADLQWKCSSHELTATTKDGDLTLTCSATNTRADRDIVISLSPAENEPPQNDTTQNDTTQTDAARDASDRTGLPARFCDAQHEQAQYMMLRWRPALPTVAQQQRRDWVFLLDADGSRDPLLARAQVEIVRTLLENAGHDDTFSILTAGTRVRAFAAEQQAVSPDNVAAALEFLDTTHLIGGLDLRQALVAARGFATAAKAPTLVHVGSGIPVLGERETSKLLAELPQDVPYVGVAVGKRWNRHLMKGAASHSGGFFTQINPDESLAWRSLELLSALNTPRLLDVQVAADKEQCKFLLFHDSVAHGDELCAIARRDANSEEIKSVTITGQVDGKAWRRTIPVADVQHHANYLPRIWAKLAIDDMVMRDAQANKAAIIALSKSMYVMSPFTSLLVLENDAMYDQYNVDRGRKDHWALYPCPEKIDVVKEPLNDSFPTAPSVEDTKTTKPSPAEVLRSLLVQTQQGFRPLTSAPPEKYRRFAPDASTRFLGFRPWGIPLPGKIPQTPRRFGDDLAGKPNSSAMFVTPRIIIQDEEPPILGEWGIRTGQEFEAGYDFLPLNGRERASTMADFDSLLDLITTTFQPDSWTDVGDPVNISGYSTDLSLVIRQSQSLYDGDNQLLTNVYPVADFVMPVFDPVGVNFTLERYGHFGRALQEIDELAVPLAGESPIAYPDEKYWMGLPTPRWKYVLFAPIIPTANADDQVWAKLDKRSDFNYRDSTLANILDDLRTRLEIPIALRTEALKQSGLAVEKKRLSISLKNISTRAALRLILDRFGLAYYLDQGSLHVTTPGDLQQHLALRSRWLDETLLLFDRAEFAGKKPVPPTDGTDFAPLVDAWSQSLLQRIAHDGRHPNLMYPALHRRSDTRAFRNLVAFAPGIGTTLADILAVLESEAELPRRPHVGSIDERAKDLINAARDQSWQTIVYPHLQVTVDGAGRFRYDRTTQFGLTETVVCDGHTLRHLYPELGLGTTRVVSRFHRQAISHLVPWLLPPAEDLAVGADLRMVGPETVAIVPHGADDAQDEDDQPTSYARLHLVFAADGRLAERQLVEMPEGRVKARMVFPASGTVQWRDAQNKVVHDVQLTAAAASQPELDPETNALVMLPMPFRDRGHVLGTVRGAHEQPNEPATKTDALQKIVQNQRQSEQDDPASWSQSEALQMVTACLVQNPDELRSIIGRRFFARGDRRIGFYTLLLSSGQVWSLKQPVPLSDKTTTRMNPVKDHPHSRLAGYIQRELEAAQNRLADTQVQPPLDTNPFIDNLSEYRTLCAEWSSVRELSADVEVRRRTLDQLFDFIARCNAPHSAYVLLRQVQRRLGTDQPTGRIAEAILRLEEKGITSYVVKYELAQTLAAKGRQAQARALFLDLYREALDAGFLPPINKTFIDVMKGSDINPFESNKLPEKGFSGLMKTACERLVHQHRRSTALGLAWQCRQLGQENLADGLFDQALAGADEEIPVATMSAVDYLLLVKDYDRALRLLAPLLAHADYGKSARLWRLAAHVADDGGRLAQAVHCAERALDLEYQNLPKRYNAATVRTRFQQLFDQYLRLAKLTTVPGDQPQSEFVSRTIQSADRWRELDADVTPACQQASKLMATFGLDDLAWDYLTTPLASKPNEAIAWLDLARTLQGDKSYDLASRAFASAFDAERTNAQILWDHAQMLDRAGRSDDAQPLYEQIARGQWQPRFQSLQQRAQRIHERRTNDK